MARLEQSGIRNRLLRALSPADFALLEPALEPVALPKGTVLIEADRLVGHLTFVEAGLASIVAFASEGRRVEVAMVGREGMVDSCIALGVLRTPHESFMQVEGHGYRVAAAPLARALAESRSLHALLLRYVHVVGIQMGATAAANGESVIAERLARWLLMCHDRLDGDELPLTHEFLAVMLAVRRAGVTDAIHLLEGAGIVRARRAVITVLDRGRLAESAGDSYGAPEAEYERLFPEPGSAGTGHLRFVGGQGS